MTINEFLGALDEVADEGFYFDLAPFYNGQRFHICYKHQCGSLWLPDSVVLYVAAGEWVPHTMAARRLGLSKKSWQLIRNAAEDNPGHSCRMRRALLQVTGLD